MDEKKEIKSPVKAIRAHCVECSGGNLAEVKRCAVTGCWLYPFRFGKNPYHKKFKGNAVEEGEIDNADDCV